MAIAVVQSVKATGATPVSAPSMVTTAGNVLVAAVGGGFNPADVSISDSDGNTWAFMCGTASLSGTAALYRAVLIVGGGTTVVSTNNPGGTLSLEVMEISGLGTGDPFFTTNSQVQPGGTGPPRSSGNVTISGAQTILIGAASSYTLANNTYTKGASYTEDQNYNNVAFGQNGLLLAHKILSSAGTYDFDFTMSDNTVNSSGAIAAATGVTGWQPYQPWYQRAPILAH